MSFREIIKRFAIFGFFLFLLLVSSVNTLYAQQDGQETDATDTTATDDGAATQAGPTTEGIPTDAAAITEGQTLFNTYCTVCHALDRKLIGPPLAGVVDRRPLPWLQSFIKNSQKVIASGDEYAVNLFNEFNNTQMPPFPFSDEEINSILAYIQQESTAPAADPGSGDTVDGGGTGVGETGTNGSTGTEVPSEYLLAILGGLLIILLLILVVLVLIISVMNKLLKQRTDLDEADREIVDQKLDVGKVAKSKPFIGILVFIFLAIGAKAVVDGLFTIGVQQGYAPEQPIAFSHELHAGQYEIDCQYCHTGVMKSKSANIPSANICMNCHNSILPESPEIQKIYAAVDYNPETMEYGTDVQPIEWVRVHNLPDLAYFNHAQHVNVGGVACQTCHGPIEEMVVVQQNAPLTMGWCIDCHKETTLNTNGNDYYDKLVELHDEHSAEPMKVKDIGGLECSKCHY